MSQALGQGKQNPPKENKRSLNRKDIPLTDHLKEKVKAVTSAGCSYEHFDKKIFDLVQEAKSVTGFFLIPFFFLQENKKSCIMCLKESSVYVVNISPTFVAFLFNLVLISSWILINSRKRWIHRPIDFPFLINTELPKANLKFHT